MTVGKTFYNIDTSSPQRHSGIVNPVADTYRGCPDISFEAGEKEWSAPEASSSDGNSDLFSLPKSIRGSSDFIRLTNP